MKINESDLTGKLCAEFHQISRNLTYFTIALVAVSALAVWLFSIDLGGSRTTLMGLAFMSLAVFTYKIPYISYRYMQRKYKNVAEKSTVLGYDWKQFRDLAMQRR
jgi:hypothetical protein